jgi:hypothetical protein
MANIVRVLTFIDKSRGDIDRRIYNSNNISWLGLTEMA